MLRIFIVFVAILFSFSDSYSQTPRFHECDLTEEDLVCNPNTWYDVTDYITHTTGCIIEVDYIWKSCTINGFRHNKLEIVGWRLMNSPACSLLYSQLMPTGVFNEIKAREIQMFLNEEISRKLFQSVVNSTSLSNLLPYYSCGLDYKPIGAPSFLQIFEATCMAHCVTTGYDDVIITVPGGGGGNPAGLINPFQLPANGRYYWVNVTNKKCVESCCWIYIDFCYDEINQTWKRTIAQGAQPGHTQCPDIVTPLELCVSPPYLLPRVTHIIGQDFTGCTHTCVGEGGTKEVYFE